LRKKGKSIPKITAVKRDKTLGTGGGTGGSIYLITQLMGPLLMSTGGVQSQTGSGGEPVPAEEEFLTQ